MFNEKLVTVWSAPNYTYRCGNLASIMELDENLQKFFKIFEAAPTEGKASDGKSVPQYFLWVIETLIDNIKIRDINLIYFRTLNLYDFK